MTGADRAPYPAGARRRRTHLGYDAEESARPFAPFFDPRTRPVQTHVREALAAGPMPAGHSYHLREAATRLQRAGHHAGETGWCRSGGITDVACRTVMPGVSSAMWDWWFGWHSTDPARYKLWHSQAHRWAAIGEDRSARPGLTDRQRYVGNVSYVDEHIGDRLQRLAIRFVPAADLGFEDRPGTTTVCARVGFGDTPVAFGWLVHQVRPTGEGSEMRSRFFLNHVRLLPLPARARPPGHRPARDGAGASGGRRAAGGADRTGAAPHHRHRPAGALRRRDEPPRRLPAPAVRGVRRYPLTGRPDRTEADRAEPGRRVTA